MTADFRYRAFISYSHTDARWARWLQARLERYRLPGHLVGTDAGGRPLPRRLGRFFRDRSELPSSSDLGGTLRESLLGSESLIVICSPSAAQSRWVNEEIRQFRALGRGERIYALVVDGIPSAKPGEESQECFPPALRYSDDGLTRFEPLAADARAAQDGKADAWLKIAAGLLGLGFDDLRQRELQRRNRRLALFSGTTLGVAALTIGLAIAAYHARNEARARRAQAEDLINFMLGDLRDRLELVGRLDVLDAVGHKAMDYFAAQESSGSTAESDAARLKALTQLGDIRASQGQQDESLGILKDAAQVADRLSLEYPDDSRFAVSEAEAFSTAGLVAMDAGDFDLAYESFLKLRARVAHLGKLEPQEEHWKLGLATAEMNLGSLADRKAEPARALEHFGEADRILEQLYSSAPASREYVRNYVGVLHSEASLLDRLGQTDQSGWRYGKASRIARRDFDGNPKDMFMASMLIDVLADATDAAIRHGPRDEALRLGEEYVEQAERLAHYDPANIDWQGSLGAARYQLSVLRLRQGRVAEAEQLLRESTELRAAILAKDPAQDFARFRYSEALLQGVEYALLLHADRAAALATMRQALALWSDPESQAASERTRLRAQLLAWELALDRDPAEVARSRAAAAPLIEALAPTRKLAYVAELRLRYDELSGNFAGAEAESAELAASGYHSPLLERFRRETCARRPAGSRASCRSTNGAPPKSAGRS